MKLVLSVVLVLACVAGCLAAETPTSAGFRIFLEDEMKNYDTWLQTAENADPTPEIPDDSWIGELIYANLFTLDYKFGYDHMVGFVKQKTERRIDYVYVELIDMHFSIGVTTIGNTVFQGNYTASGELETGLKLEGSGVWNVTCTSVHDVYNITFEVDENGFVSLYSRYSSPTYQTVLELDEEKTYFEGVWDNGAGGFGPEIKKQMGIEIKKKYEKWDDNHPTGVLLHRFLNETFQKAPLADIINTKRQEQTTTTEEVTVTTPEGEVSEPEDYEEEETTTESGAISYKSVSIVVMSCVFVSVITIPFN